MMSLNLFQSKGLVELTRYLAPDTLFAFDLDGTLAPLVDDPARARVPDPLREVLGRLTNLIKVSVITGRSRNDALQILGVEPHLLIGNHGAEWPPREGDRDWHQISQCLKWRSRLADDLFYLPGVEIEHKGETLSIHYRKAPDREQALRVVHAALAQLEPAPRVIGGKCVVNLLPKEAATKGEALVAAMAKLGTPRAVYFGDDLTDEEVFRQQGIDLFGIHIGAGDETAAPYHLNAQSDVLGLLHSMAGIMEVLTDRDGGWKP